MDMPNFENNDERRPSTRCRGYVHVVEAGDTLYKLAKQYDVKLFDIMRLNPYVNVYNLKIGDEICIPTTPTRPERNYVVNEGDTIERLLQVFGVDFETLAKWNPTLLEVELPEGLIVKLPLIQPRDEFEDFDEDDLD